MMLSSKFLVVSFLYLFYATGVVVAAPKGGNQACESPQTVTITQPPPSASSPPPNNANAFPAVLNQRPGNVNLGNNKKNGKPNPSSVSSGNNNNNNGNNTSTPPPAPSSTPPATTNDNGTPDNNNPGNGDPSTSLTLDPSVIQKINGKGQAVGETDSLVSTNNFINFCVGKTITNGLQVKTGSCNPTPMGDLPDVDHMPSAKFTSPKNMDTIPANTQFTISLAVNNLVTGTFTNAAATYFAAPQQLVGGVIQGHSHVTVQQMDSLDSTQPLDPKIFAFFKGLNDPAQNGILSTTVTNGLPAGVYRISSINSAGNHQDATGPVAQRGSFNDAIYITVTDGQQNTNSVSSPAAPPTTPSSTSPPANGGKGSKTSSTDSLPVPTSVSSPDVPPVSPSPAPTGINGKNNGGKNNNSTSSQPPVPSPAGGKGNGKKGNPKGPNSKRVYRRSRFFNV